LTEGRNPNSRPAWSPDGTRIAFVSTNGFGTGIALIDVDGRNYRPLNAPTQINETPRWSPDGTQIVFESGREIYIMNPDGSALRRLTRTLQPETMPTWRP
jgi:Tol biopolymer transport system component